MGRTTTKKVIEAAKMADDIMLLNADESNLMAQKELDQGSWTRQFRSSLHSTVDFFANVSLRKAHYKCLKRTPFYRLILPFAKHEISISQVTGTQIGTVLILKTYNKEDRVFKIGGRELNVTEEDCNLIFGIKSGEKIISIRRTNKPEFGLTNRKFRDVEKIRLGMLKPKMLEYIDSRDDEDVEDVVRIIILHVLTSCFFATSGDQVSWWMVQLCDELYKLSDYNWAGYIVDFLIKYVQKTEPSLVRGCTTLLLYWMCERINIIEPIIADAFPRFQKWNLKTLGTALEHKAIRDIHNDEVNDSALTQTEEETEFFNKDTSAAERSSKRKRTIKNKEHKKGKTDDTCTSSETGDNDQNINVPAKFMTKLRKKSSENRRLSKQALQYETESHILREKNKHLEYLLAKYAQAAESSHGGSAQPIEHSTEAKLAAETLRCAALEEQLIVMKQSYEDLEATTTLLQLHVEALTADNNSRKKSKTGFQNSGDEPDTKLHESAVKATTSMVTDSTPKTPTEDSMPSFRLLSQTQPDPIETAAERDDPLPLTYVDKTEIQLVDLITDVTLLKDINKENSQTRLHQSELIKQLKHTISSTKKTSNCPQISAEKMNVSFEIDGGIMDSNSEGHEGSVDISADTLILLHANTEHAESIEKILPISDRTRSKRPAVTPTTVSKVVRKYKKFKNYRTMSESNRSLLDMTVEVAANKEYTKVWTSPDGRKFVCVKDLVQSITHRELSSLSMKEFNKTQYSELEGTSYVFPCMLLSATRNPKSTDRSFHPPANITAYRYLLFPLHSDRNPNKVADHFTLVVFDRLEESWNFYNSLLPRENITDKYLVDAHDMKTSMQATASRYNIDINFNFDIEVVKDCPQQTNGRDCGVHVLYCIKQIFHQQPIDPSSTSDDLANMPEKSWRLSWNGVTRNMMHKTVTLLMI
ncbi:hypothetical protein ABFS83_14G164900 [Erythranthe nasuta]